MYEVEKTIAAWTRVHKEFEPDPANSPFNFQFIGEALEALDRKHNLWAVRRFRVQSSEVSFKYVDLCGLTGGSHRNRCIQLRLTSASLRLMTRS